MKSPRRWTAARTRLASGSGSTWTALGTLHADLGWDIGLDEAQYAAAVERLAESERVPLHSPDLDQAPVDAEREGGQ